MQLAASKKKHVDTYILGYVEAPNGAIANKRLLDGADKVGWLNPTIEQQASGVQGWRAEHRLYLQRTDRRVAATGHGRKRGKTR